MPHSLLDISSSWGGDAPHSLSEYYRGGSYVPSNWFSASSIPSSGPISIGDFIGVSREATPAQKLTYTWDRRQYLHRTAGNPYYGVDAYTGVDTISDSVDWGDYSARNGHPNRYQSTVCVAMGYGAPQFGGPQSLNQSGQPGYSDWTSLIVVANSGVTGGFYNTFINGQSPTIVYSDNYGGRPILVAKINIPLNQITSFKTYYSRGGGNYGSWAKYVLVPGQWNVYYDTYYSSAEQFYNTSIGNTTAGYADFQTTAPPGSFTFFNRGGGIDNRSMYIANYDGIGPEFMNWSAVTGTNFWWYNSGTILCAWNLSNNTITGKVARTVGQDGYGGLGRNYNTFDGQTRITTFYQV